jgi:membrane-bound lytic murein transglycosylase B
VGRAQFRLREAVRAEQVLVYELAKHPARLAQLTPLLTAPVVAGLRASSAALEAAWRLFAVDDLSQVHPRYTHLYSAAEPVASLAGYYRDAAGRAGIDWSYLAALNFIESDFGRVDGPSSAGALGPMQFIPSTWSEYGGGGDIMSPHDSIQAAAALLARNGAPADYDRAIFRYNHDSDYVAAVKGYAAAIRSDPLWLTRLYYWSTYG